MKGQTLLEVLIALGVGIAILSGIVGVVLVALTSAQFSKNQNLATQYGQEGMEVVRGIRYLSGFSSLKDGTFCLGKNQTSLTGKPLGGSCAKIDNFFTREVEISWSTPRDRAQVTVTVLWTDAKGPHTSKLVSYITQAAAVPTLAPPPTLTPTPLPPTATPTPTPDPFDRD